MIKWMLHSMAWASVGGLSFWFGGRVINHFNPKVDKQRWS